MKEKIKPLSVQACTKKNKEGTETLLLEKNINTRATTTKVLSLRSTPFDGHRWSKCCNTKHKGRWFLVRGSATDGIGALAYTNEQAGKQKNIQHMNQQNTTTEFEADYK